MNERLNQESRLFIGNNYITKRVVFDFRIQSPANHVLVLLLLSVPNKKVMGSR